MRDRRGFFVHEGAESGLVDDLDEVMANLAEIWGWMPDQMDRMPIADLVCWHKLMVARRPKDK